MMRVIVLMVAALLMSGCGQTKAEPKERTKSVAHLVHYFEIPVTDMDRAVAYYEKLLGVELERQNVDGYDMALFPFAEGASGATGALAKGDVYRPSKEGAIVYFTVDDIKATVARAEAMGSKILYPVKDIGEAGFVAEVEDSEGNRLALNQRKETAE
jgi:uncharacterized protein